MSSSKGATSSASQRSRSSSSSWLDTNINLLVRFVALAHVLAAPYTKVEESFNIQAVHDWLFLGPFRLELWDHIKFPGAVPRSFIPSLLLSIASYPALLIGRLAGYVATSADVQTTVRCVLALLWAQALLFFARRVSTSLDLRAFSGDDQGAAARQAKLRSWIRRLLLILTLVQFRLPFYAGRLLPNSLAMPLVLVSLGLALPRGLDHERDQLTGLAILVATSIIVRLECLALVAALGLYLVHSRIYGARTEFDPHPVESVAKLAGAAQASATVSAALTAGLDRWMWRVGMQTTWTWPELEAGLFNVVQGKSVEWGIEPWHFYLSSALPGMLLATLPLTICGGAAAVYASRSSQRSASQAVEQRNPASAKGRINNYLAKEQAGLTPLLALLWIAAVPVALLSLLKHKEWRFVIYVAPCLNVLAALGAALMLFPAPAKAFSSHSPLLLRRLIPLALTLLTLLLTLLGISTSAANYPGGEALRWTHEHLSPAAAAKAKHMHMHIDVAPAMTGVSLLQSMRHASHRNRGRSGQPAYLPGILPEQRIGSTEAQAWVYDKSEDLPRSASAASAWDKFDVLLSEVPCDRVLVDPHETREVRDEQSPFALARSQNGGDDDDEEPVFSEHAGLALRRRPLLAKLKATTTKDKRRRTRRSVVDWVQRVVLPRLPAVAGYELALVTVEEAEPYVRTEALALVRRSNGDVVEAALAVGVKRRQRVWVCERVR